ncbi:MAG: nuclear transport factor 2 family protein [Luminiphilus sp.]|nr:nuclear transport factor 2 family protein [Luminiphilus sp.]
MKTIALYLSLLVSSSVYAGHHEEGEVLNNIATAKAGYDAFNSGDMETWRAVQAENAIWTIQVGLPYTGTYVGPAAVEAGIFAPIGKMWPEFKVDPIGFYESGDTVFVHVHMTAEGLDTQSIHMIKIKDGKYVAFQPFDDSAAMLKAAKP